MNNYFQRDIFIDTIFSAAKKNKNILFISADFGAPALDDFREQLPNQFIHSGISEQHMIDFAAGLALSGKQVYVYAMAPFITLRCLEQIKCSLAMMSLPVTIIAVGVGLGYADAGPTHYLTEDIACMKSIIGLDIYSASDSRTAEIIAKKTLNEKKLRIVRLERHALPNIYNHIDNVNVNSFCEIVKGNNICILSYGHLLHRAKDVVEEYNNNSDNSIGLIDIYSIKPLSFDLKKILSSYKKIITYEEQGIQGGFGSSILEFLSDHNLSLTVKRLALNDRYYFENGGREYLLDSNNLSKQNLIDNIKTLV